MRFSPLYKIFALLLTASILLSSMLALASCSNNGRGTGDESSGNAAGGSGADNNSSGGNASPDFDYHEKINPPAYKEYPRKTVKFDTISYKRPDFEAVTNDFLAVIDIIEKNAVAYDEQLNSIESLEAGYEDIMTMYSLANIYNSKNSAIAFWNEEYAFVSSKYPAFAGVIEDLYVAAANSPHAENFEADYFGDGLIEDYKKGGILTDNMIKLWSDEEELEARYSSISTATVKISYNGMEDTVDNIISHYLEKYGNNSREYLAASSFCMQAYKEKTDKICQDILIDLIKIRRLIADELGYESYQEYAYKAFDRDYTPNEASAFFDDIAAYAVPVYNNLYSYVFDSYFKTNRPSKTTLDLVINNTGAVLSEIDNELFDIYNYMLLFELYDVEIRETNRFSGSFTTYLDSYEAPFVFISASGTVEDYSVLMHEFGHFADSYINFDSSASIDQLEISSQGLEYLMLVHMEDTLARKDLLYLTYSMLCASLETLIEQGFYAKLEALIYELSYEEITKEKLDAAVVSAAKAFGLNETYLNDISIAFIPHIFIQPFYVQSYCISLIPALELYFAEADSEGSGLEAYKKLIDRTENDFSLVEAVKSAGLASPFDDDVIKSIVDRIYFKIRGSHFYSNESQSGDAA